MLTLAEKSLIAQCFAAVRDGVAGFNSRKAQQEMMMAVAPMLGNLCGKDTESRRGRNILVVERPTGSGKTITVLIPALVLAKSRGKRLVYSSSTVPCRTNCGPRTCHCCKACCRSHFRSLLQKGAVVMCVRRSSPPGTPCRRPMAGSRRRCAP
jgi:hypothetical protein